MFRSASASQKVVLGRFFNFNAQLQEETLKLANVYLFQKVGGNADDQLPEHEVLSRHTFTATLSSPVSQHKASLRGPSPADYADLDLAVSAPEDLLSAILRHAGRIPQFQWHTACPAVEGVDPCQAALAFKAWQQVR
eukprot:2148227-Amphidinium_carterae.1